MGADEAQRVAGRATGDRRARRAHDEARVLGVRASGSASCRCGCSTAGRDLDVARSGDMVEERLRTLSLTDRGGHVADPAQHHRRAAARPARESRRCRCMNFDLTDDQDALRDGIRSLCEGRFPMKRVRGGLRPVGVATSSPKRACSRCAPTASVGPTPRSCSRSSGAALVPGPLVWGVPRGTALVDGVVGGRRTCRTAAPSMVEHLDALDALLVARRRRSSASSPARRSTGRAARRGRSTRSRRSTGSTQLPDGRARRRRRPGGAVAAGGRRAHRRVPRRHGRACTELSVAYAKERRQFDRPIGSFQAVKHILADMAVRTEVARAVGARGRVHARRSRASATSTRAVVGRQAARGRGRRRQRARRRPRCTAAWASPGRSTSTST